MKRYRRTRFVTTLSILLLVLSSVFAGAAVAESSVPASDGETQLAQANSIGVQYVCTNYSTRQMRLTFYPSCSPNEMLIDVLNSFPFDYCHNRSTGVMFDDNYANQCAYGQRYVVEDGTSSFFVCYNIYTRQMYHLNSPDECTNGILVSFVDLRGDITKYACVEENLNPNLCDILPAGGAQNEIRQIAPLQQPIFQSCPYRLEFNGFQTAQVYSCVSAADTSAAGVQAALESLGSIGAGNVLVTAIDAGEHWSTAFDNPATAEDESTSIRVEFVGTLAAQDILPPITIVSAGGGFLTLDENTVIDGTPAASPGLNNLMPDGMVQIFRAGPATDPNNPATYGPEVAGSPQAVDATGKANFNDLLEGDYVVCADGTGSVSPSCEIVTINANELSIVNNVDLPGTITAQITDVSGTNEVQFIRQCSFGCAVTGGTFTITVDGQPTNNLDADATMAEVETQLELLPNVDQVSVTGSDFALGTNPGNEMQIEFQGVWQGEDVPELTIQQALTGQGFGLFYESGTVTQGSGEVHTLTLDSRVSGGTFTLAFNNGTITSTTGPIAWDATVGQVEAALNALPSINGNGGSVTVSSANPIFPPENTKITAGPFEVNFSGVTNADINVLIVDNTNLE